VQQEGAELVLTAPQGAKGKVELWGTLKKRWRLDSAGCLFVIFLRMEKSVREPEIRKAQQGGGRV